MSYIIVPSGKGGTAEPDPRSWLDTWSMVFADVLGADEATLSQYPERDGLLFRMVPTSFGALDTWTMRAVLAARRAHDDPEHYMHALFFFQWYPGAAQYDAHPEPRPDAPSLLPAEDSPSDDELAARAEIRRRLLGSASPLPIARLPRASRRRMHPQLYGWPREATLSLKNDGPNGGAVHLPRGWQKR